MLELIAAFIPAGLAIVAGLIVLLRDIAGK
jgi:hypothetical protein